MPPDPVTQSTLVSQFCAITNTNTPSGADTAQRLLNENDWSIERALDRMYAEPAGASPRRTAGESSSVVRGPPSPVKTTPGDGRPHVARLGLGRTTQESSGLLWPLKMVLRIVTSLWYLIVRSLIPLSFLPFLPRFLLPPAPTTTSRSTTPTTPAAQCLALIHTLEAETGNSSRAGTLPPLFVGGYKDFLREIRDEAKVGCAVVLSAEHEDDGSFKRDVLCDVDFIKCIKDNDILLWACDIRYQDGYQVYQTLQLTTFPSLVFFSLLPTSSSPIPSSNAPSRSKLTILSTLSGPPSSSTSASSLIQAITTSIIPRTRSYLTRLRRDRYAAAETRRLREEQDRALEESARKDRERMRAARREVEEKERMRVAEQAREEREERERRERKQNAERLKKEREEWRRWARGQLPSEPADVKSGIRVMVRLPANSAYGGRAVRIFPSETTIDSLFNWVETLFIPTSCRPEDDPQTAPGGRKIWTEEDGGEVIRLYTAYPRAEVTREGGWKVVKDAGGSLVVEVASDGEGSDGEDEDESEEE